ncbi:MAG: hypothetical protein AB8B81_05140 [Halioglobus sp.]
MKPLFLTTGFICPGLMKKTLADLFPMIIIKLLSSNQLLEGGMELLSVWREDTASKLWLDMEGELTDENRQVLAD